MKSRGVEEENERLKARIAVLQRDLQQLAASEARHRQIVELVHEGIGVTDAQGRWTYTSRRLEQMLG